MKRCFLLIGCIYFALLVSAEESFNSQLSTFNYTIDEIVLDIYNAVTEFGEVDYEQLQTDLYALHESPIDLNHTSEEELSQLWFLSPKQIDDLLVYADKHPFESLYELRMIPSLADYEIRDLLPFVTIRKPENGQPDATYNNIMYAREVFHRAQHEILTRVDARDIEQFEGKDPMFVQTRYRFDFQRRVVFGAQLRRPAGGRAKDLQYGAYLQLRDIGPLHTLVAGNYQASFGQGLVLAPVFHSGKSSYVTSAGQPREGLRYYSSSDGEGLHGLGATFRWNRGKATRLDVSALYSMRRYNDSTWHHLVGANLTFRHKQLQVELTAIENIWSDSIHPYRNAKYNRHYFRGRNQFVGGASVRYNYGWFDAFAEVAAAQNYQRFEEPLNGGNWGVGVIAGSRFYPAEGVSLIALYRYYSPYFDNELGYAFSESSRLGDENGGYLGFEITRWRNWKISGYGDVFYFRGYKYGLGNDTCTLGYDAAVDVRYARLRSSGEGWWTDLRLRARKKGKTSTYSTRFQFNWTCGGWSLRTTADANLVDKKQNEERLPLTYGVSVAQDVAYTFRRVPLSVRLRLQGFDARNWDNRIYLYEHDVLYAWSIPATYGLGGRGYLCVKWQILPQLAMYLRLSETIYARRWYNEKHPKSVFASQSSKIPTKTDIHLLFRIKL